MQIQTSQLVLSLISYILGGVSGWFLHDFMKTTLMSTEQNSKNFLLLIVSVIWAMSALVSLINPAYVVPIPVHGIMGVVVGFFFYRSPKDTK